MKLSTDEHWKSALTTLPADGLRVLIVEDNPHSIELYRYVLRKLATQHSNEQIPVAVDFSPDGYQALERLSRDKFDLVLTDLFMPVMDGFALVEKIRVDQALRGMRILVISGGGAEAQERAMTLGVDGYLRKPVQFEIVLQEVKRVLAIT